MMRASPFLLILAVAFSPVAAAVQDWTGGNGVRVVVTDDGGQPLPGVTVVARLAESSRSGGPPPLLTDAAGAVEFTGLAAGEWQVELRREGFMIVSSYLRLEDGKRPQVGFTSRQRTGSFWAPMQVGYSSPGVDAAVASAGSARAVRRAQRRAERRAAQRQRRQRGKNVARIVEPASVEESERSRLGEPESEAAPEADARPEPEPAGARLLPDRTLLGAGACPECEPGEWSVASRWPAPPRTEETVPCAADLAERMGRISQIVRASLPADFRRYVGALADPDGNDVQRLLPEAVRAEVRELLRPLLDPRRSCQILGVFLPEGARFVGFLYEAADLESRGSCLPEQPCEIGEASWRGNPVIHRHEHGVFVHGVFENHSTRHRREASLKVYFRPPRGWLPPR